MKYIYLDWNVIQYMKHETIDIKKSINGKEFRELIENISKKYLFPFSEGHLKDLLVSSNPANMKYIKEDLNFLKEISKNHLLGLDENENCIPLKNHIDISTFFNDIKDNTDNEKEEEELTVDFKTTNSFEINLEQMENDSLYKSLIEQNNGILDNSVLNNFIFLMYEDINSPDFYKKFRLEVSNIKKSFQKTPNSILNQQSEYFKELVPFIDFLLEKNIKKIKSNFNETMVSFLNIDKKRTFEELTVGSKIELAYSLLDFNPNFRDKITRKNKPSNMFRDIKNLYFASQAKYYITEDDKTYIKSKLVCEVLDLKVKVLKMDEFIIKFR